MCHSNACGLDGLTASSNVHLNLGLNLFHSLFLVCFFILNLSYLEAVTGTEYQVREYLIEGDTVLKEEVVFQDLLEMCLDKVDQYVARGVVDV